MADDTDLRADWRAMETAFQELSKEQGDNLVAADALAIARRYPRPAALTGATATYFALGTKADQPIALKNPWKSGLALKFSKPVRFDNNVHLADVYQLAITQRFFDAKASGVAMLPFFYATLQESLDRGMTMHEFKAAAITCSWTAHQIVTDVGRDLAGIRR